MGIKGNHFPKCLGSTNVDTYLMRNASTHHYVANETLKLFTNTHAYVGGSAAVVAISMATPMNMGETALLSCVGTGDPGVVISWRFDGEILTNTTLFSISERDFTKGGGVFKQSFLQICSVTPATTGNYTCNVVNGLKTVTAITQITGTYMGGLGFNFKSLADVPL